MVVRDVADAVGALRIDLFEVSLVGGDRLLVGRHRVRVAPDAHVDVRRHVQQVTRARHGVAQPVRARQRSLRVRRRFHQVDPVMIGAGVLRRERERAVQQRIVPGSTVAARRSRPTNRTDAD